ncbi:MAG: radical SAM protein [Verrucomicrobia bacterium]|nr:radical SAM protein [Verrucomicrobiota bacterium]
MTEPVPRVDRDLAAVRDHTRSFADFVFVYPVISRRAGGLSLGVNLNPDKRCNFDCVYCEVDRRTPGRAQRVDLEHMRAELTALIRAAKNGELGRVARFDEAAELTRQIRDIAFSGDGEPTMIPNFAACVETVIAVKQQEGLTDTKIVLITDAAGLDKADVRQGLVRLDAHQGEIWGKLDAGTEAYYRQVNRTHVRFERILKNLLETARVRPIVIQSLFLKLHGQPLPPAELEAYCARLNDLTRAGGQIKEVHAYTIARPTPEPWATRLEAPELEARAAVIQQRTGLRVLAFA